MVSFYDPVTNSEISYHLDEKMVKLLTKIKELLTKKDKDYVMIVDGYEGSGKSTASQQWGKFVDHSLDISRICMTSEEFKQQIMLAKKGQCVIYDEAVTGMSSGDSITKIGRLLKSLMMQMRQKNLFVIVIIPTFFELNKYTVLSRARSFFHVYESKGRMGYFAGYNKKDLRRLYFKGKKSYSYLVRSQFIGRFYGKYVVNEEEYRKKKQDALELVDTDDEPVIFNRWKEQRDFLIRLLRRSMTIYELEEECKRCKYPISKSSIAAVGVDAKDPEEVDKKEQNLMEIPLIPKEKTRKSKENFLENVENVQ